MPYKKIVVTDAVKKKLMGTYEQVKGEVERADYAARVIEKGLEELLAANPPGESPRVIPRAQGGKRTVGFVVHRHKALDLRVQAFRRQFDYDTNTTAYRACLYQGLGVPHAEW